MHYTATLHKYVLKSALRIRDPRSSASLTHGPGSGSGIGFSGSRIQNPYFWELSDKSLGKKFYNSLKTGPNFFLEHFKNKIIFNFVKFVAIKKVWQQISLHSSLLLLFFDPGSGTGKNQDPRSGINIPDPQHCLKYLNLNNDQEQQAAVRSISVPLQAIQAPRQVSLLLSGSSVWKPPIGCTFRPKASPLCIGWNQCCVWIRIRICRMCVPDPSLSVRIWILPLISQKSKKSLDIYYFVTFYKLFIFEAWCECSLKK
jgi:hypothetical protein